MTIENNGRKNEQINNYNQVGIILSLVYRLAVLRNQFTYYMDCNVDSQKILDQEEKYPDLFKAIQNKLGKQADRRQIAVLTNLLSTYEDKGAQISQYIDQIDKQLLLDAINNEADINVLLPSIEAIISALPKEREISYNSFNIPPKKQTISNEEKTPLERDEETLAPLKEYCRAKNIYYSDLHDNTVTFLKQLKAQIATKDKDQDILSYKMDVKFKNNKAIFRFTVESKCAFPRALEQLRNEEKLVNRTSVRNTRTERHIISYEFTGFQLDCSSYNPNQKNQMTKLADYFTKEVELEKEVAFKG
jgi:hypothetical protein